MQMVISNNADYFFAKVQLEVCTEPIFSWDVSVCTHKGSSNSELHRANRCWSWKPEKMPKDYFSFTYERQL